MTEKDVKALQDEVDNLEWKLSNAEEDLLDAQQSLERVERREREAQHESRRERKDLLELLRRVEFSSEEHCPICRYPWAGNGHAATSHAPGCDLKISIMKLETSIVCRPLVID